MTQTEAGALAAKLSRIWVPERVNPLSFAQIDRDGITMRNGARTIFLFSPDKVLYVDILRDGLKMGFSSEGELVCRVVDENPEDAESLIVELGALFRRNCWLSGCAIEATAHEQIEWLRHGRALGLSEAEMPGYVGAAVKLSTP